MIIFIDKENKLQTMADSKLQSLYLWISLKKYDNLIGWLLIILILPNLT